MVEERLYSRIHQWFHIFSNGFQMAVHDVYEFGKIFLTFSPAQKDNFLWDIPKEQCEPIRQAALNVLINSCQSGR